ncbi:MAG: cytochrome c, partial [Dehalococcoidia bacterium]|nr:cytochrome c [Dehalococcoidia bacterium]
IGSEAESGIPYWIWAVLPEVFPDLLAARTPGRDHLEGYERLGFIDGPTVEEGGIDLGKYPRPMGTSIRVTQIPMLGLNCAACHVGTVRTPDGTEDLLVLGMPAQQLDFLAYERFILDAVNDPRFTADVLIDAIRLKNPAFSFLDRLLYRYVVIPQVIDGVHQLEQDFEFALDESRSVWGPGRVETFTPYRVRLELPRSSFAEVGTVDFPSIWNQDIRVGMELHWDGNNISLQERNYSAAIGAGASEDSLDEVAIARIARWIRTLRPEPFPEELVDTSLLGQGSTLFTTYCAACHALDGERIGQVEPIELIGTDRSRLDSFDPELAEAMNTLGAGKPWKFTHFRSTDGYANAPIDGLWLRAPYLHNGSVPTLADLLAPPADRPTGFCRGSTNFDYDRVGFVSTTDQSACNGFWFDTAAAGNGNEGHDYATDLTPAQKQALLEYLKTQ